MTFNEFRIFFIVDSENDNINFIFLTYETNRRKLRQIYGTNNGILIIFRIVKQQMTSSGQKMAKRQLFKIL